MQIISPAEICAVCAVRGIELLSVELLLIWFASPGVRDMSLMIFRACAFSSPGFYASF